MSDSSRPHGLQPTRLLRPWDFPGKSIGVRCYCLLRPSLKLLYFWDPTSLPMRSSLSCSAPCSLPYALCPREDVQRQGVSRAPASGLGVSPPPTTRPSELPLRAPLSGACLPSLHRAQSLFKGQEALTRAAPAELLSGKCRFGWSSVGCLLGCPACDLPGWLPHGSVQTRETPASL